MTAGGAASGQTTEGRIRLDGHRTLAAVLSRQRGRVPSSQQIPLTLALSVRDPQGLDDLLHRLYDPQDPLYRQFLTPRQFTSRFSPTLAQCAAVSDFARAQGLTVTGLSSDRLLLHLAAPSAAVEAAFGVHLNQFLDNRGRMFHAPDADPSVPATVAPFIVSVVGLDDSAVFYPHSQILQPHMPDPLAALETLPLQTGGGPGGALRPADIRAAYNLSSVGLTGRGQTLAVFELDGYAPSDITGYENAYGLPQVPLQNVLVDGGSGPLGNGQGEVTLDIELQIALAPGISQILVYEGPNTGQGLLDTYSKIAADDQAKQISTSWGLSESEEGTSLLNAESILFQKMAAQGQTLFAAAGDSGAYDDGTTLSVDDPASQPYVTGVGGTSLRTAGIGGAYQAESTWTSGGGGVSAVWPAPYWQQGVISAASLGSLTLRNVPDVALDADPNTGYSIYLNGGWYIYGGTSCASPLWAAFTALVNQQRAANGAGPLGFANPALYAIGTGQFGQSLNDFHDIADRSTNSNGHGGLYYPAVTGYDEATGWGSFNGAGLLADLTAVPAPPTPTTLTATPGNTQAVLSWTATSGATAYNLYRSTQTGGEGSTPYKSGLKGTTFTDAALTNGTTYYYRLTAISTGGESAGSNEASVTPTVPASALIPSNASLFVSQSVPSTMTAGQAYPVSVTFTNTGNTPWTSAAAYHLGSQSPQDNQTWGLGRVLLPSSVAPGQSVTVSFNVTAPSTAGTYPFQWRMVQDGVQWFGDFTPTVNVVVTGGTAPAPIPGNASLFVSQTVPSSMTAGQVYPVTVTMQNRGTTPWTSATAYHLGSQSPQDNQTWGLGRVFLPNSVAPGQSVTVTFSVTAPAAAGTYPFQWRMVQDGVQWFGDFTPTVNVAVTGGTAPAPIPGNAASFVSKSVPATMTAGQTYPVSVTFTNTGSTTWTSANAYHLGSQSPQDNQTWGFNRVLLPSTVAPGQSVTVTFSVTAPSTAGTYPFQWRMVQDGVQWFGDFTTAQSVVVN